MLNNVLFAILGMVMVQGVVGVPQLVPCGASGDAPCILPQACCDFSTIDPSLGFFHRLAAERKKRKAEDLARWRAEARTEKERADKKRAQGKGKAAPKATYVEVYDVVSDTKFPSPCVCGTPDKYEMSRVVCKINAGAVAGMRARLLLPDEAAGLPHPGLPVVTGSAVRVGNVMAFHWTVGPLEYPPSCQRAESASL
ncbi:hypothetical protein C8R44DRAFT_990384 [Mycena epipterygia]|nr:hypothetical protein C8R44DRAFT_990384 [Mycena epipterygia]